MMPKSRYTARDCLLSLTDQSNWPEMNDQERVGYAEAMDIVHDAVMDFWAELTAQELTSKSEG